MSLIERMTSLSTRDIKYVGFAFVFLKLFLLFGSFSMLMDHLPIDHIGNDFFIPLPFLHHIFIQDGIQLIESAYATFSKGATEEELRAYIFELQNKADMNLAPSRICDFIKIIYEKDGLHVTQEVTEFILLVHGQFFQMMVKGAFHI